jgi:glycosyltransferase involved in cell wall biosynthesis
VLTGGWESRDADPGALDGLAHVDIAVAANCPVRPVCSNHPPLKILRLTGILLRSLLQMPDNRFRFLPRMAKAILKMHGEEAVDVVLVTSPPNSMSLLLPILRWMGLHMPLVLDVRDLWALDPLMRPDTRSFRAIQRALERWALGHANAIVTVTPGYANWLDSRLKGKVPVHLITNGYDEEDWQDLTPVPKSKDRLVISHAGSLGGINGPRSILPLAKALETLLLRRPAMQERLALKFIGCVPAAEVDELRRRVPMVDCEFTGFLTHSRTLEHLAGSDILLLLHFDLPYCAAIYPGKLFEYYRLGLPILACTPPGLVEDFVRSRDLGECAAYGDSNAIADALERLVDRMDHGPVYGQGEQDREAFERGALAEVYGELLKELVERDRTSAPKQRVGRCGTVPSTQR